MRYLSQYSFLAVLSFLFVGQTALASTLEANCAAQLVRANIERYQQVPTGGQSSKVTLKQGPDGKSYSGKTQFDVPSDRPGAKTFSIELSVWTVPRRSVWAQKTPRFYVKTILKDEFGEILGMAQEHSDKVFTPKMLEWLKSGELRTLSNLYNASLLEELNAQNIDVTGPEAEANLMEAVTDKLVDPEQAYQVESFCILEK